LPLAACSLFRVGTGPAGPARAWPACPPFYPGPPPARGTARDLGVRRVAVSQTNFESAPAVVRADVSVAGFRGEPIAAVITDEAGQVVGRPGAKAAGAAQPLSVRFPVPAAER